MTSARKLSEIPSCMRMSFIYPWETSPEKEIDDPLSYGFPDITSDLEVIYGEGAAKYLFPSTPTKGDVVFPVLQDDSQCVDVFPDWLRREPALESPSKAESPPTSSSGYASDLSSLFHISPTPSPKHGVPGGKKEQRTTINNARVRCLPYKRRPLDSSPSSASPPSLLGHPMPLLSPTSSPCSSTSSSVSSDPDDALTPEFMRSLQFVSPIFLMGGPSSLPESPSPAPSVNLPLILPPRRHSKLPATSRPPPARSPQNIAVDPSQQDAMFAHRYCRFPKCNKRFADKRTTERHRLTHLEFGTYVCPNPACDSRTKARPNFASDFSLGRHLRLATDDSPCAVGKGHKLSSFRLNAAQVEALIQPALVPFDPAIHTPF